MVRRSGPGWATEAFEKGLISEKETLIPLKFGDAGAIPGSENTWVQGQRFLPVAGPGDPQAEDNTEGTSLCPRRRWQVSTGEYSSSPRRWAAPSHLDAGGVSYDQKQKGKDAGPRRRFPGSG